MNTIIFGDCVKVMQSLPDELFDLAICDPPYGNVTSEKWDNIKDYEDFSRKWIKEVKRLLKPHGSIYIWCSLGPKSSSLLDIGKILKDEWYLQDMVVWQKQRGRGNRKGWLFTREEVLWATKTQKDYVWNKEEQYSTDKYHESWIKRLGKENNPYKRAKNVWSDIDEVTVEMAKESGGRGKRKAYHIAQKPLAAIDRIIKVHTKAGDYVLDPFAGSGTTAVSAKNLGRQFLMIENDFNCCKIINERLL